MVANPFGTSHNDHAYNLHMRSLREIREKVHNGEWVRRHEADLRQRLTHALNFRRTFYRSAIENLVRILPVMRGHETRAKWGCILEDAYLRAMELRSERLEAELQLHMAEWALLDGNFGYARVAADLAQRKIAETEDIEIQVMCYVVLLRIQPILEFSEATPYAIRNAIQLAKRLDRSNEARAHLYHALAVYFSYRGKPRAGNYYARRANGIWKHSNNRLRRIACAIIIANNATDMEQHRFASRIFELLQGLADEQESLLYLGYFLYARGRTMLVKDEYQEAARLLMEALTKFRKLSAVPMIASCYQALGLVYASILDLPRARRALAYAQSVWHKLGMETRLVDVLVAQVYVARQEGNLIRAMCLLAQASDEAKRISNKSSYKRIATSIEAEASIIVDLWNQQPPNAE